MSVQTSASRPTGRSAGAATVGLLVTLAVFVVVFLAFLIAPLILLGVAYFAWVVMRPRAQRPRTSGPAQGTTEAFHGFGAGTR